jgi:hypothetical protein
MKIMFQEWAADQKGSDYLSASAERIVERLDIELFTVRLYRNGLSVYHADMSFRACVAVAERWCTDGVMPVVDIDETANTLIRRRKQSESTLQRKGKSFVA